MTVWVGYVTGWGSWNTPGAEVLGVWATREDAEAAIEAVNQGPLREPWVSIGDSDWPVWVSEMSDGTRIEIAQIAAGAAAKVPEL